MVFLIRKCTIFYIPSLFYITKLFKVRDPYKKKYILWEFIESKQYYKILNCNIFHTISIHNI